MLPPPQVPAVSAEARRTASRNWAMIGSAGTAARPQTSASQTGIRQRRSAVSAVDDGAENVTFRRSSTTPDRQPRRRRAARGATQATQAGSAPAGPVALRRRRCLAKVRVGKAWDGIKLAFEFLVLTATRSAEVRLATWQEIDLVSMVWTIPQERMKATREHRIPLSKRAVEVLRAAAQLRPSPQPHELVFTGVRGRRIDRPGRLEDDRSGSGSTRSRTASGRRSGTERRSGRTTRARWSKRPWRTPCGTRPRLPTRGRTCSSAAGT